MLFQKYLTLSTITEFVLLDTNNFHDTFSTPFGRYCWLRMPFGINSVPEIFQAGINQFVKRLTRIEVYMDDIFIIGRGEPQEEALTDHDHNLVKFLEGAGEREDCNQTLIRWN